MLRRFCTLLSRTGESDRQLLLHLARKNRSVHCLPDLAPLATPDLIHAVEHARRISPDLAAPVSSIISNLQFAKSELDKINRIEGQACHRRLTDQGGQAYNCTRMRLGHQPSLSQPVVTVDRTLPAAGLPHEYEGLPLTYYCSGYLRLRQAIGGAS